MVGIWSEWPIDARTAGQRFDDFLDFPILYKRNLNQYITTFWHVFDFAFHISYILNVPIYSDAIYGVMVASLVIPFIPLFYLAYLEYKKNGDNFYAGFMLFTLSYGGIYDIYANKIDIEPHLREV